MFGASIAVSFLRNFVIVVVLFGLCAGFSQLFGGAIGGDTWSPRAYVPAEGECFVPPQGDPLYDEHYAKNVNNPNCVALKTQSEARQIDALTDRTRAETMQSNIGIGVILLVIVCAAIFFTWAGLKRTA
jgi:hypothetical protein